MSFLLFSFFLWSIGTTVVTSIPTAHFVCENSNDIYQLLSLNPGNQPFALRLHDTIEDALSHTQPQDSLFILLDDPFPNNGLNITLAQYALIANTTLAGVYIEMPVILPDDPSSSYVPSSAWYFDRVTAVTNQTLNAGIPYLTIIQAQGAWFANYPPLQYINTSVLAYAHVAGSSVAVYGLPAASSLNPVLFTTNLNTVSSVTSVTNNNNNNVWIGAIKLSCLVTCRYTPVPQWMNVWNFILGTVLQLPSYNSFPSWVPLVHPTSFNASQANNHDIRTWLTSSTAFPTVHERNLYMQNITLSSFNRATSWLASGSELLIIGDNNTCPSPYAPDDATIGCVLEGFSSKINANGTQEIASDTRMDCSAETAMALALRAWSDAQQPSSHELQSLSSSTDEFAYLSATLMNFTWVYSIAAQGPRANPNDPSFGLVAWGVSSPSWSICTYADDNARVLGGSIVASSILRSEPFNMNSSLWDEGIMRSLLGNLRISSRNGFRPGRINFPDIEQNGWEYYANSNYVYANVSSPQPHYQAQMWSVFLWAFTQTNYLPFYTLTLRGIEDTMRYYPATWRWTEYLSEEQCRFILTLAWLVRADTYQNITNATHISWLQQVTQDFVQRQQPNGGIQEWFGTAGYCDSCPPSDNDQYGDGEAPIIQVNGDTFTDQLYSNNYALVSLWEAYKATNDYTNYGVYADALAIYLASIQLQSDAYPRLDGSWMRGFDYVLGDYFGSASDWGWGPWSIEVGWTTTWISAGLVSRIFNTSVWDIMDNNSGITPELFNQICPQFFSNQQCQSNRYIPDRSNVW